MSKKMQTEWQNSVDPNLFTQACRSENLGSLQ